MLKLIEIDFFEFKEKINSKYEELFPEDERQEIELLEKLYEKGIIKFVKIIDQEILVGFLMYVTIKGNPYVWLDYFAIFKEYQNQNYGSKAIGLLKEHLKNYDGIYGEIETLGLGENEEENQIRIKRAKFWTNLGFEIMNIDLEMFNVIYSACVLKLNNSKRSDKDILEYGLMLYKEVIGEERFNKNCFVLNG